jgi:hypothetical protein
MKLTIIGLKSFTSGSLKGKLFALKKWMSTFDMEKWEENEEKHEKFKVVQMGRLARGNS